MLQSEALTILKTGANVFLTGEPGSGKSHTVNAYVAYLRTHGIEPSVTASTGIAATHIGGLTIHSWSGIGIKDSLNAYDIDKIMQTERTVKRIRSATTLIIDEISMLAASTLDMVDAVCRAVRNSESAFGGLQVILVGDFFQLPPIVRINYNNNNQSHTGDMFDGIDEDNHTPKSPFAYNARAWSRLNPLVCYLTEQHRQDDLVFLGLLGAIRQGEVKDLHRDILNKRKTVSRTTATKLYAHNADVDRINDMALADIKTGGHIYQMTSSGASALVETLKRGCLSPETLALKVGAKVIFTKNDPEKRFANGTLGTVMSFALGTNIPLIETNDGRRISAETMDWNIADGGKILARITQIPLRLAWAITVHKSQGMSLDAAHMDLSKAFEYGQGYVAISRVRTLEGLTLDGFNQRALEVHPEIKTQDRQFRLSSHNAAEAFELMPTTELASMHKKFIFACGGSMKEKEVKEVGEKSKIDILRETYKNAYRPWSDEEDVQLRILFEEGSTPAQLSKEFGRKVGAIHMRLIKLGLIEEDVA